MKKTVIFAALAILLAGTALEARSSSSGEGTGTGIGVVVGYPGNVGLSIKIKNFPVLGLAWYLGESASFGGTVDWWIINNGLGSHFYWYLGVGGYIKAGSSLKLGPRLPVGLQWFPEGGPFELALEAAPALQLLPGTDLGIQGSFALRYHF